MDKENVISKIGISNIWCKIFLFYAKLSFRKFNILRKQRKLNQLKFSNILKIKRSTYANGESGHSEPPISALQHISSNLGISLDDLINKQLSEGKVSKEIPENEIGKVSGKVLNDIKNFNDYQGTLVQEAEERDKVENRKFNPATKELEEEISKLWYKMHELEGKLIDKLNTSENDRS